MVNPPAPPEIPRPTIDDFNEMRAKSTLSLNQVYHYIFILCMFVYLFVFNKHQKN